MQLERLGVVLADDHQPGARLQLTRQCGQRLEAAIQPLGLEARADLHQQQIILAEGELTAKLGADLGGVGRRTTVHSYTRGQQMEALRRRGVMLDEQRLLHLGDHQDLGVRLGREHRPFVLGEMLVAAPATVQRVAQGLRLVFEAAVGGVIHVQPRHLVETDHPVDRALAQISLHPGGELLVAVVVEQRLDRHHHHLEALWHLAFPDRRVHADAVAALLALQGNAHEVALQPAVGEVLVEDKSQAHRFSARLHQSSPNSSNRACSSVNTRCGFRSSKQGVSRSPLPASGPLAHRCTWERP